MVPGPNMAALPSLLRPTVILDMCLTLLAGPYQVEPGLYLDHNN